MVTLGMLWLPIVVSVVVVFVASNIIWMVLRFHRNDWRKLPDEEAFCATLGAQDPAVGEYNFPFSSGPEDWKSEEWQAKFKRGPVGYLTVVPTGVMAMGKTMTQWILYLFCVILLIAYLGSRTLEVGASFSDVFQVLGTAGILGFAAGIAPEAIWLGRRWANILRMMIDGIVYGLLAAAVFGWLWP